jgi:hypothetical protein
LTGVGYRGGQFIHRILCQSLAALVTNLRADPWERYQSESMSYGKWWGEMTWTLMPAVAIVGQFLLTFKEYPPSQANGSVSVEKALQMLQSGSSGSGK